jgi:arsenite oxidase small subunit
MTTKNTLSRNGESRRRVLLGLLLLPITIDRISPARAAPDVPVGHLSDLAQPWSAVKFTLPDSDGSEMPCIVIHLPGDRWYASSLICPHNKCTLMYVTDVDMVRDSFNVETTTPALACPCHFSVFDPAQGGQVIGGPAPNPPLQLRVTVRGNDVFVGR